MGAFHLQYKSLILFCLYIFWVKNFLISLTVSPRLSCLSVEGKLTWLSMHFISTGRVGA